MTALPTAALRRTDTRAAEAAAQVDISILNEWV